MLKLGYKTPCNKSLQSFLDQVKFKEDEFDLILLDGVRLTEFTKLDKEYLERFKCATMLNLSMTGLINLKNLPYIGSLESLDMSDNSLMGDDLYYIAASL